MLRALLHRAARRFERRYRYDAAYLHEAIDISPSAALRLAGLNRISGWSGGAREISAGALLASSLDGDCGPCAQLTVDLAIESGVDPTRLRAAARRDFAEAGEAGLGFRFAEAAIAGDPALDTLRAQIIAARGERAALAASFAAATGRAYPVLKRGLGHGAACARLRIDGVDTPIRRAA